MRDNVQKYLYAIKVQITEIMDHTIDTTWAVELNTKKKKTLCKFLRHMCMIQLKVD